MKKTLLTFILFISFISCFSQNITKIDSLKNALQQSRNSKNNLLTIKTLNSLSSTFFNINIDSSYFYSKKTILLAKKNNAQNELAIAYNNLGECLFEKSNYYKSISFIEKAIEINKQNENTDVLANNYFNIAIANLLLNRFPETLQNLNIALNIFEKSNNNIGIARVYNSFAILYDKQNNKELMWQNYNKALSYLKDENSKQANVFKKTIKINLAIEYSDDKEYEKALKIFYYYYNLDKKNNVDSGNALERSIGKTYFGLKNYTKAIEFYNLAIFKYLKTGNKSHLADSYRELGKVYFELKKYNKAIELTEKALLISKNIGELESIKFANKNLSKYYAKIKNYKKAFQNEKDYKKVSDSMFNSKIDEELTQIKYNYELKKIEEEFITKQKNKDRIINQNIKRKKLLWFSLILSILLFSSIIFGVYHNLKTSKKQNSIIQNTLNEKEVLLKEIHHRVKNNLQVISSILELQVNKTDNSKLKETLKEGQNRIQTIALIHEQLYQNEDISSIKFNDYILDLTKHIARFSDNNINFNIKQNNISFDINTAVPLGLIVNELITNSYKHAFNNKNEGVINIELKKLNTNNYNLIFADNGIGFKDDFDIEKTDSLGLKLVSILTKQLKGTLDYKNNNGAEISINFRDDVSV